jgi:acyl-CoA thioester hydrolase
MLHKTKIRVRYGETDQMGIVYHPNYYIYFEMGRSEFLRELGHMSYKDMEESGIMMPLIETHCKYILPAKYDDELIVETSVKNVTVVRMIFYYRLFRAEDGILLAEGETSHAFVNKAGKPINLKKVNKQLFEKLCSFIAK